MIEKRRWTNTFPDGVSIETVCIDEEALGQADRNAIDYRLEASAKNDNVDGVTIDVTEDGVTASPDPVSAGSKHGFVVSIPEGSGVVRTYVNSGSRRYPVFLPGPVLHKTCAAAIQGDTDAAERLLEEFDTPLQIPAICGAFLTIAEVGQLVETLTQENGYVEGNLHAYRYNLIRGALATPIGLSVRSADELEALVDTLDEIESIGHVEFIDALGDTMATFLDSENEMQELLADLECDLPTVEEVDDGLFFTCHLAQLVLSGGIRAAEGHAMRRRWNLHGNYKRRKTQAKNASYQNRGRAWRQLLCTAARQSLSEFAFVLANALYWSGEVSRTDSRMDELLLEAATIVASEIGLDQLEGRAQYERYLSKGHRLRSQSCYVMARAAFDQAGNVAREYDYLPEWEPVYTKATVHAAEHGTAGNHEQAVAVLDDALGQLFEYDIPAEKLNRISHHLKGQKLETKALLANFQGDSDDPVSLLRDARSHYDAINLNRSRDRIHRKLKQAKQNAPGAESGNTSTAETPQKPEGGEQSQSEASSPSTNASKSEAQQEPTRKQVQQRRSRRHVRSEYARDEFEGNPELNDFLTPSNPDEVGSADLMTSPEDRDENPDMSEGWGRED